MQILQRVRVLACALVCSVFCLTGCLAATCTSIANGDWNSGATWDCGLSPAAGDIIIINTNVTLNVNVTISGSLTVNTGHSLIGTNRSVTISSTGTATNNGTISIKDLTNAGHFTNNGSVTTTGAVDNTGIITNNGDITVGGNLRNNPGGTLNGTGGTFNVDINAINSAGGFISGSIDFRSISMPCQDPFNSASSGTIDWASGVMICGVTHIPLAIEEVRVWLDDNELKWISDCQGFGARVIKHSVDKSVVHVGETSDSWSLTEDGVYSVEVFGADGVSCSSGLVECALNVQKEVRVYCADGHISVSGAQEGAVMNLYDSRGALLTCRKMTAGENLIEAHPGLYAVSLPGTCRLVSVH